MNDCPRPGREMIRWGDCVRNQPSTTHTPSPPARARRDWRTYVRNFRRRWRWDRPARKVDRENSGDAGSEREEERRLPARKSGLPPSRTRSLSGQSWRQSFAHRRRREGRAVHPQERRKPCRDISNAASSERPLAATALGLTKNTAPQDPPHTQAARK